jgi:hypothetical protein
MNHRTIIIGCGKAKRYEESPARELYTGSLFVACRRYAEASGHPWAILSASHGIICPDQNVEPYDAKLALRGPALENWAMNAAASVRLRVNATTTEVVCLAGANYAVPFAWALAYYRITCVQPLVGMQIGMRLRWLKQNTRVSGSGCGDADLSPRHNGDGELSGA